MYRSARLRLSAEGKRNRKKLERSRVSPPCAWLHGRSTPVRLSRSAMISFQPRNHAVDQARRAAVRRVADWVEQALPEEQRDATHVMVNQVECREEGCPPVECVVALLRKPKIVFRVRPRHACIAMSCCPTLAHAPRARTPRSLIAHPA